MLVVLGKIISIVGILLLFFLFLVLIILLLVLFFPVSYRVNCYKHDNVTADIKANWMFGLIRVRYYYPKPGKFVIKLLGFPVYDSSVSKNKNISGKDSIPNNNEASDSTDPLEKQNINTIISEKNRSNSSSIEGSKPSHDFNDCNQNHTKKDFRSILYNKFEMIKYTIFNLYDKIKLFLEHITFYNDLFKEEDTKFLLSHVIKRIIKMGKGIYPQKIKAEIIFGTGSPDTTGYIYGIYGILSPKLGQNVTITPDFSEMIFKGEIHVSGHIVIVRLLFHTVVLILDKRLRLFINKIKEHEKTKEKTKHILTE